MRRIEAGVLLAALVLAFPAPAAAATDPECLKHLGGAFAGVECFNGLANDLQARNAESVRALQAVIPAASPNRRRLTDYLAHYRQLVRDCDLARESMDDWKPVKPDAGARYRDADVLYYQCVYDLQSAQATFLSRLLANAGS
jgi:hypothetical protein